MKTIFLPILALIVKILSYIFGKKEQTQKQIEKEEKKQEDLDRIKEDNELKEAIQRGDYETVARIRKKRKEYNNL
jgi:protein-arginine kinase activator protein McsA